MNEAEINRVRTRARMIEDSAENWGQTPEGGVIRLEKWSEGYVLWYHGEIVWRSWEE